MSVGLLKVYGQTSHSVNVLCINKTWFISKINNYSTNPRCTLIWKYTKPHTNAPLREPHCLEKATATHKNSPLVWSSVWGWAFIWVVGWILCSPWHMLILCHPCQHPVDTWHTWHLTCVTNSCSIITVTRLHTWEITGSL